jgi:hypothetical protein
MPEAPHRQFCMRRGHMCIKTSRWGPRILVISLWEVSWVKKNSKNNTSKYNLLLGLQPGKLITNITPVFPLFLYELLAENDESIM